MAKRKKRIATVNRKLGISINCRVQKPVLKDLDAYRKSLKLSRSAALPATLHRTVRYWHLADIPNAPPNVCFRA